MRERVNAFNLNNLIFADSEEQVGVSTVLCQTRIADVVDVIYVNIVT
jgi:hypothetical protein